MNEIDIREARIEDIDELERLWSDLIRDQEALDDRLRFATDALARWRIDLRIWVRGDVKRIWVASDAKKLIGFLSAESAYAPVMFESTKDVFVQELYIERGYRRRGVAGQLLEAAAAWARGLGARSLSASVLSANDAGRSFWYGAGARPFHETVRIPLSPDADAEAVDKPRTIGF